MKPNRLLSIAPMMGYTDRHFRYLIGLISPNTLLYTEMVHAHQILHGDHNDHHQRSLIIPEQQNSTALQLGGSHPEALAESCKIAEKYGYAEFNLNVGCPSERVQKGSFGACLMRTPELVAECVAAMSDATSTPVTIKTRLGVDHDDSFEFLSDFIELVSKAGCNSFTIHARKAWLKGLSPKENRTIPPLDYQRVYLLKERFPQLEIIINGGIKTAEDVETHLEFVDGVMIGREACSNPWIFSELDQILFGSDLNLNVQVESNLSDKSLSDKSKSRFKVFHQYIAYIANELKRGTPFSLLIRPLFGLFHGVQGAKAWRGHLSTSFNNAKAHQNKNLLNILEESIDYFASYEGDI